MPVIQTLYDAILNGNAKAAKEITQTSLASGVNPQALVDDTMIPAMNEVGRRYEANEYFVPELLIAARAMKASLELIRPLLSARGSEPVGRVVIGTVQGDLHDIGKNLGVDVSPEKFINAAKEKHATLVALSALLTTTMHSMKGVVEKLNESGMRPGVKVMIGGAPVTQKYADEIGADGYSSNANAAVALARRLVAA